MARTPRRWMLPLAVTAFAADPATSGIVRRIADTQAKLPWFWSRPMEGIPDIPYTYEMRSTRRVLDRRGREIPPSANADALSAWRTLHLERIALDWGSHFRCVSHDGQSPCAAEWIREFDRQAEKRTALTPADRLRIDAEREQRRDRRRAFWAAFPTAMRFEPAGPDEIRFKPAGRNPGFGLQGLLRFDPASYRITHIEYEALGDIDEPLVRVRKGDRFAIDLALVDGDYLPARTEVRRQPSKDGRVEEVRTGYTNFRRFASESQVRFADPP